MKLRNFSKGIYQVTWEKVEGCQIKDDNVNTISKLTTSLIDLFHCFDEADHWFAIIKKQMVYCKFCEGRGTIS